MEQQVKETLYATARDAAGRNRNSLWAERNGLSTRVSFGSHFGLTTTTKKSTKSQSILLITFNQNAFCLSTNSLQVSDIRIDAGFKFISHDSPVYVMLLCLSLLI